MSRQPAPEQPDMPELNPLRAPSLYNLSTLLRELKWGRPANDQIMLDRWIAEAEDAEDAGAAGPFDLPEEP